MNIGEIEYTVAGKLFRIARLRHEWFEFLEEPAAAIENLKKARLPADLFTFVQELHLQRPEFPFHRETTAVSLLKIRSFDDWWENLHFKARNKARKAEKSGVEIRSVSLDDDFVHGVQKIYNESPLRQGRKFTHYGKDCATIKDDLSSFPERSLFVGAYFNGELIGFMKLFEANDILRMIHMIATYDHRDKCVTDALIARAVKICGERNISHLHFGDWASRGLGVFRMKYNFQRHDCLRYFVPLNLRGKFMLNLRLHLPLRERLPQSWTDRLVAMRNQWNTLRYRTEGSASEI
jgi:hypothetical protein